MRRLLMLAALLAGCDDESIPARVANAQLHGFVAAQIDCSCSAPRSGGSDLYIFRMQKLVDGSCFASGTTAPFMFLERSEVPGATCAHPSIGEVADGLFDAGPSYTSVDITTCCTGFNLEAFGVSP